MSRKSLKKNVSSVMEGVIKRRKRNQQKHNEKKRLQSNNFSILKKNDKNFRSNELTADKSLAVSQIYSNNDALTNFKVIIIDGNNIGMA